MKIGSLFSGGGLGDLGFEMAGFKLAFQIEINEYCNKILERRWPNVRRFQDIKKVKPEELEKIDVITGGFPCQPFSLAGKRRGKEDDRNLWPEMRRIIRGTKPRWVVAENVPGIVGIMLDEVLSDLEAEGYETIPIIFPAHALGAPHKRDRLWIVAHARCEHGERQEEPGEHEGSDRSRDAVEPERSNECNRPGIITDTTGIRRNVGQCSKRENQNNLSEIGKTKKDKQSGDIGKRRAGKICKASTDSQKQVEPGRSDSGALRESHWSIEPGICRVVNGMPNRVDRLKLLGNGQVVYCTKWIGERIMEYERKMAQNRKPGADTHIHQDNAAGAIF